MRKRLADATPFRAGLGLGGALLVVVATAAAVWHIRGVLTVLFLATFAAVGLDRVVAVLTRRGMSRPWAITALVVGAIIVVCGALALAVPPLVRQARALLAQAPAMVERALDIAPLTSAGTQAIAAWITPAHLTAVLGGLVGGVATAAGFAFVALTAAMLSVFILAAQPRLTAGLARLYPASRRAELAGFTGDVLDRVGAYLAGSLTIAATAGTTALVFMWIAGIPYALVLALIVALFDLIPQIGATLAATIVAIVALSELLVLAIIVVIYFIAYQQTENWFIYPRVMKHAVNISNLAALVAVLVGAALFGFIGVLIAVPGYATCQLIVRRYVLPARNRA